VAVGVGGKVDDDPATPLAIGVGGKVDDDPATPLGYYRYAPASERLEKAPAGETGRPYNG
jgi:hypothetical protein